MGKNQNLPRKNIKQAEKPLPAIFYKPWFYIILLFLLVFIFLSPGIFGNGFNASDNVAWVPFENYLKEAKKTGQFPLWMPYIFSGMPSFASFTVTGDRVWDFISKIYFGFISGFETVLGSDGARVAMHYVIYAIGVFLLMRSKKHTHLVSFITACAAVLSTGIIIWIMIGHNTKPVAFSMIPWVFLFMEKLINKFSLLWASLLVLAIHILFESSHVQMIFYAGLAFALYLLYELIARIITKNKPLMALIPAASLVVATALAFMLSADRYMSIWEYTPHSVRGSAPLLQDAQQKQTRTGGNDYDYATMWSFSPEETITFFVPNYFGFGKMDYKGPLTGNREVKLPTYWGQKPFEDAAPYMGIIVLVLAIVGATKNRKDIFVQFLIFLSLFVWILSFGRNFPVLYDLFYYNVPFFNKFRAPSMVLALLNFAVPVLAGYGISSIIQMYKENQSSGKKTCRNMIWFSFIFLFIGLIIMAIFKESYYDAMRSSQSLRLPEDFYEFIWNAMLSDWFINAFLILIASLLTYLLIRNKVKLNTYLFALLILIVFDLWRVDRRPMEIADQPLERLAFPDNDVYEFIKQDKGYYRIADFASSSPNISVNYFMPNVNGYQAAKLRVYQDMLDATSNGSTNYVTSPFMWNLLGVKYILSKEDMGVPPIYKSEKTGTQVIYNPSFFPNAFFIDTLEIAKNVDILMHLRNQDFNPRKKAYLMNALNQTIDLPSQEDSAIVTKYANENIIYKVNSSGNCFLLLNEVYYPDWKAYLDGKEIPIYQTNYFMRGVVVPKGNHNLELKFYSQEFETGKTLSLASNILLALLLILSIFFEMRNKKSK